MSSIKILRNLTKYFQRLKTMNASHFFSQYFKIIERKISSIDIGQLEQIAEMVGKINYAGKKVILVGNGGSAAMASHVAVDFSKNAKIRMVNFKRH